MINFANFIFITGRLSLLFIIFFSKIFFRFSFEFLYIVLLLYDNGILKLNLDGDKLRDNFVDLRNGKNKVGDSLNVFDFEEDNLSDVKHNFVFSFL